MQKFSWTVVGMSFLITVIIQSVRQYHWGISELLDLVIGSSPSFFYVVGLAFVIPIVKHSCAIRQFISTVVFIVLGALVYEYEQLLTHRQFDTNDLYATFSGGLVAILLFLLTRSLIQLKPIQDSKPGSGLTIQRYVVHLFRD